MDNNKGQSYQRLRLLYEKKYLKQDTLRERMRTCSHSKSRQNESNSQRKPRNWMTPHSQHSASKQAQTALDYVQTCPIRPIITDQAHLSIEYKQADKPICTASTYRTINSRRKSRGAFSNQINICKIPSRKNKTIAFIATSRDQFGHTTKIQKTKPTLIQMISDLNKMKDLRSAERHPPALINHKYQSYKIDKANQIFKQQQRRKTPQSSKHQRGQPLLSTLIRQHQNKIIYNTPKETTIDPWIVVQNDEDLRKYY